MVGETIDAGGEKSDLNFGGAGVTFVLSELSDNGLLLSGIHSHSGILLSDRCQRLLGKKPPKHCPDRAIPVHTGFRQSQR